MTRASMTGTYPPVEELKAQAKRLRQAMMERGSEIAHAAALELIARQYGARDWNTLSALAAKPNDIKISPIFVGAHIRGHYLSQPFTGQIVALQAIAGSELYRVTIHFDAPVDVVTFESFSCFRQRIHAQIDENGVSPRKTSNGLPHLVLDI